MSTTNLTTNEMTVKGYFPPDTITFSNATTWVMRITADRRIEVSEGVEVTEAAQAVLDALAPMLKKPWVGLTGWEINRIFAVNAGRSERMMQEVENLLKEKNSG
jgi:hypothetical protein